MIKKIFFSLLALVSIFNASAQFTYTFKDTTTPYVPLTGATSLNGALIWDDEKLVAPMPFTWTVNGNIAINQFNLMLGYTSIFTDTVNTSAAHGFVLGDVDIVDRGIETGITSLSPIRYTTTGTAPNRIFKMEIANAGFAKEYYVYGILLDSINLQVWVYETSNIVEIHYGSSQVSDPASYFYFNGTGPIVANARLFDFDFGNYGTLYLLSGNPSSPMVDSFTFPISGITLPPSLNSWPADGTVYRFTPKSPCIPPTANLTAGTPSGKTVQYTYSGTTTTLDSLVWAFGDGQKQKVTSAFTTPVSHTYAANGSYMVCVTAYNSCSNNNFCKQQKLGIGNLSTLSNVKVYPNPADDRIYIEGMQPPSKAVVSSMVGQQLIVTDIRGSSQSLDISLLSAGTYLLRLIGKDGLSTSIKIMKQ